MKLNNCLLYISVFLLGSCFGHINSEQKANKIDTFLEKNISFKDSSIVSSVELIDDYCVSDFEKSDDYHLLSRDYNIKLSISFKDDASPMGDIILEYKNEQVRYDSIDYAGCIDVSAKLFTSIKKKRFYILLNCMYEYSNEYYIFIIDGNQSRYLSSYSHSILSDKVVEYHYSINVIDDCETLIISEIDDGKEKVIHKQKI